jgi:hypothetical protein
VHRDAALQAQQSGRAFQAELLAVAPLLQALEVEGMELRWRPHPADNDALVAQELAQHSGLQLSRDVTLEEDAAWADVIVSSVSTAVIEVLFAGVPVFVHALPEYWEIPATSFIDRSRLFFHADDGARAVASWLRQFRLDPAAGLNEERRAMTALFGESRTPIPVTDYVGSARSRPLPT